MIDRMMKVSVAAVLLAVAGGQSSLAQIGVPAPAATPTAPVFTPPPPPPPPAPQPPPAPEVPVPDLVTKDAKGKLVALGIPTHEAALQKMTLRPDQQEKYQQVRKERAALYDRHLTRNLKSMLQVRSLLPNVNDKADLGTLMKWMPPARDVVMPMNLSKMLTGAGVIDTREAEAISKAEDNYVKAATEQVKADFQSSMDQGVEMGRFNFKRMSNEPIREFDRMLFTFRSQWSAIKSKLGELSPEAAAAEAKILAGGDPRLVGDATCELLTALGDKAASALEMIWTPLPTNRLVPDAALQPQTAAPARPPIKAQPVSAPSANSPTSPQNPPPQRPAQPAPTQPAPTQPAPAQPSPGQPVQPAGPK